MALELESVNSEYLSASDATALDVTGNITLAVRVKFATLQTGKPIIGKYAFAGNQRSYVLQTPGSSGAQLAWNSSSNGTSVYNVATTDANLTTGVWYALVVTYDNSTVQFYRNGTLLSKVTPGGSPGALFNGSADFDIGAFNNGGSGFVNGEIAEAVLCDFVWTGSQAGAYALGFSPMEILNVQPRGYWPLYRDGTDWSGNGNNLALNGTIAATPHPPVIRYRRRPVPLIESAGSGSNAAVLAAYHFRRRRTG